jgi:hypothetical protein
MAGTPSVTEVNIIKHTNGYSMRGTNNVDYNWPGVSYIATTLEDALKIAGDLIK